VAERRYNIPDPGPAPDAGLDAGRTPTELGPHEGREQGSGEPRPDRPRGRKGDGGGGRPERAPLQLERLIHERIRLGIVSALAVNDTLTFKDLRSFLRTSDGNLSVHARKLEDAGYVTCEKTFKGRVPRTVYRLTPTGRAALERYLGHMEAIIHTTRGS